MQQLATFQVYNASAGSGKTFTLVKEYLKVLLATENIFTFQKILAITFTNKAASEMKERVISSLEAFSEGKENDLLNQILEEIPVDKAIIQERSKKILAAILQNYAAFSITTIDSFTHKVIKNFAYDLGLPLNFDVEMDASSLLHEAVDVLISKIGVHQQITKLLINYALDKIDEDKSWDISNDLNDFAQILLKEEAFNDFKVLSERSLDDFFTLRVKLINQNKILEKNFIAVGNQFLALIEKKGLEPQNFYGSYIPKFFKDLSLQSFDINFLKRSQTIEKAFANSQFYTKSTPQDIAESIEEIVPEVHQLFVKSKTIYGEYILNAIALKSIIPLAVLNHINRELENIKLENNIRLNAEFNQLISDNIKEQPAPYIYERLGQHFQYYFIDEMQDTSVLQWQNLIPLIENALAQEHSKLLLVGDGKQAIYRWRGGKVEQFIDLGNQQKNTFLIKKQVKNLDTNYRSYSEIIDFNNNFFQHVAQYFQNKSYQKLFIEGNKQNKNSKKGGHISVSFLEEEKDSELKKIQYPAKVFEKINEIKSTFSLSEICVLVRKKKEGVAIANYLSENGIAIISSETLLLKNSYKVTFIIDVLKLLQNPDDDETRFEILYFLYNHLEILTEKHVFINQFAKAKIATILATLRQFGVSFDVASYQQSPLYAKVEEIIRGFCLTKTSDAYLQFLLDIVLEQQRKSKGVSEFLEFWELQKEKLSIVAPEGANAVQIMTIHKSKGLEFPVVIFPCDLEIYRQIKPKIWFDDLPNSFQGFSSFYIDYSEKLKLISDRGVAIYNTKREEQELDNFNLLYVALTRAVEQLHIITGLKITAKNEANPNYFSGIFINFLKEKNKWNSEILTYKFGSEERVSIQKTETNGVEIHQKFITTSWQDHNLILLTSASKLWDTLAGKAINYGNLLHQIFAKIKTTTDVASAVKTYQREGVLAEKELEEITKVVLSVVHHPNLKTYFSDDKIVFNEREIVTQDNQIIIPDRLVFNKKNEVTIIDYKTGAALQVHHQQLTNYERVLERMNLVVRKKILIYINEKIDIVEVSSKK